MMKGQIQEQIGHIEQAREAYKLGVRFADIIDKYVYDGGITMIC